LKDFETAITHYNRAFEEDNTDVLALNNMAAVYIEMGKLDDALAQCDKAIKSMDDNLCYDYMKRAKVYARKGSVLSK
jgi:stress-induced-phosphoprotein 1